MCGRLTLKTPPAEWSQLLLPLLDGQKPEPQIRPAEKTAAQAPESWSITANWHPRYNIAPTQEVSALVRDEAGLLSGQALRWGLVPSWAADLKIGSRMINARAETIDEKKSFAKPLESKRCLILADGYYEWRTVSSGSKPKKQPCWISPKEGGCMLLAGLWESNQKATGDVVRTCTIITTAANESLKDIHDRMPVMLCGSAASLWLDPNCNGQQAKELLGAAAEDFFAATHVSTLVNNVRNDAPECITPTDEQLSLF